MRPLSGVALSQLADPIEQDLESEGLGEIAIRPRFLHEVLGLMVTRREPQDGVDCPARRSSEPTSTPSRRGRTTANRMTS